MYIVQKNLIKTQQRNNITTVPYSPSFHQHKSDFLPVVISLQYFYNRGHFCPDSAGCLPLNTNHPNSATKAKNECLNDELMPAVCLSLDKGQCVELPL